MTPYGAAIGGLAALAVLCGGWGSARTTTSRAFLAACAVAIGWALATGAHSPPWSEP